MYNKLRAEQLPGYLPRGADGEVRREPVLFLEGYFGLQEFDQTACIYED